MCLCVCLSQWLGPSGNTSLVLALYGSASSDLQPYNSSGSGSGSGYPYLNLYPLLALLPNSRPIFYKSILPTYEQVYCNEMSASPYLVTFVCASGYTVRVPCPARKTAVVRVRCPGLESRPQCYVSSGAGAGAGAAASLCSVVEYSPLNRSCLCESQPARRRLGLGLGLGLESPSTSSSSSSSSFFSFSATLVAADVIDEVGALLSVQWEAPGAGAGSASVVAAVSSAVAGGFFLLFLFLFLPLLLRDRDRGRGRGDKYRVKGSSGAGAGATAGSRRNRTIRGFFDSVIPARFSPDLWYRTVYRR